MLVTRAEGRDGPLCELLRASGASVVHLPSYRIAPSRSGALRTACADLARYDWLVFTSAHAVAAVAALSSVPASSSRASSGRAAAAPASMPRVAVVGAATAHAARAAGWSITLQPRTAEAAALARALVRRGVRGRRILLPSSSAALPTLRDALRAAGGEVEVVTAYRLQRLRNLQARARTARSAAFDLLTFTSPSTIDGLAAQLGTRPMRRLLARVPSVVMGATTAAALERHGVRPAAQARPTSLAGLVRSAAVLARRHSVGRARHQRKAQGVSR